MAKHCLKVALRNGVRAADDRIKQLELRLAAQHSESSSQGSGVGNVDSGADDVETVACTTAPVAAPAIPLRRRNSAKFVKYCAQYAANHSQAVGTSDRPASVYDEVLFAERRESAFLEDEEMMIGTGESAGTDQITPLDISP